MRDDTTDRRVLRTRSTLRSALISLILQKHYHEITIKDIIDEANVGRSTFYAHYTSKDDLLISGFENLRLELIRHQKQTLTSNKNTVRAGLGFSLVMFEHVGDHKDVYNALVGNHGGSITQDRIRQITAELVDRDLPAISEKSVFQGMPRELVVHHIVGSFMAVLGWWLDNNSKLSPPQIDQMFHRLIMDGIPQTP